MPWLVEFGGQRVDDRLRGLVLDEEAPEFFGDELGALGFGADHVQHVFAGKIAGLAEDRLGAVVVIAGVIFVMEPVLREAPAGVGLRRLLDVLLGVMALAEGEEFHHFAGEVLVGLVLVAARAVEVIEHGRVLGTAMSNWLKLPVAFWRNVSFWSQRK
jgi:hypothetical protein